MPSRKCNRSVINFTGPHPIKVLEYVILKSDFPKDTWKMEKAGTFGTKAFQQVAWNVVVNVGYYEVTVKKLLSRKTDIKTIVSDLVLEKIYGSDVHKLQSDIENIKKSEMGEFSCVEKKQRNGEFCTRYDKIDLDWVEKAANGSCNSRKVQLDRGEGAPTLGTGMNQEKTSGTGKTKSKSERKTGRPTRRGGQNSNKRKLNDEQPSLEAMQSFENIVQSENYKNSIGAEPTESMEDCKVRHAKELLLLHEKYQTAINDLEIRHLKEVDTVLRGEELAKRKVTIVIQKKYKDVVIGDKKKDWSEDEEDEEQSENEAVAGWYGEDENEPINTEMAEKIVDELAEDCLAQAGVSSKPHKKQKSDTNLDEDETLNTASSLSYNSMSTQLRDDEIQNEIQPTQKNNLAAQPEPVGMTLREFQVKNYFENKDIAHNAQKIRLKEKLKKARFNDPENYKQKSLMMRHMIGWEPRRRPRMEGSKCIQYKGDMGLEAESMMESVTSSVAFGPDEALKDGMLTTEARLMDARVLIDGESVTGQNLGVDGEVDYSAVPVNMTVGGLRTLMNTKNTNIGRPCKERWTGNKI